MQIRAQLAVPNPTLGGETGFSCGISKWVLSLQFCHMCLVPAATGCEDSRVTDWVGCLNL